MSGRVIRIERLSPRDSVREEPERTTEGYRLCDPAHGKFKHRAQNSAYVRTLDEAAELIGKGFSLWMISKGKRASLFAPKSLRFTRDDEARVS